MGKGYQSEREAYEAYEKRRNEESRQWKQTYIAGVFIIVFFAGGLLSGMYLSQILSPQSGPPRIDLFQINSMTFFGTSGSATNAINMSIKNTGWASWTIDNSGRAQVNTSQIYGPHALYTVAAMSPTYNRNNNKLNCTNGNTINIAITGVGWTSGNVYYVTLLLTDGVKITYAQSAQ
jgi:hypothetical protein